MPAFWQDLDLRQPVNRNHPLNRGKVAWWLCLPNQYGGGDLVDLMLGRPAFLTNFVAPQGWSAKSQPGGANSLLFSTAANQYLATSNPVLNITGDLTVIAWIYKTTASTTNNRHLIGAYNPSGPGPGWAVDLAAPTGNGGIAWFDGTTWYNPIAAITLNTWTMIALTCRGNLINTFLNGRSLSSATQVARSAYAGPYAIGGNSAGANCFDGYLSDLALYNRGLTQAEVSAVYQESRLSYPNMLSYGDDLADVTTLIQSTAPPAIGTFSNQWLDLNPTQILNPSHPLNQNLGLRLIALPGQMNRTSWKDLASPLTYPFTGFATAGSGWSNTTTSPNGAGSIRFFNNFSNYLAGPSGRALAGTNALANYTWWGWVRFASGTAANDSYLLGERSAAGNWMSKLEMCSTFATVSAPGRPTGWSVGGVRLSVRDDSARLTQICGYDNLMDGYWHFVVGQRKGTQVSVSWSMGAQLKTTGFFSVTGATGNTSAAGDIVVTVGTDIQVPTLGCNGWLNDLGFASYVLSPSQLQNLLLEGIQGYPNVLQWRHERESILELVDPTPPVQPQSATPWPELDHQQPLVREHPLNQKLALRLLAIPQLVGSSTWTDLASNTAWQLQNFPAGYGWNHRTNPGGGGSIRFSNPTNQGGIAGQNVISGPTRSLVSGSSSYTWWAWIKHTALDITKTNNQRTVIGERPASGSWISKLEIQSGYAVPQSFYPFGITPGQLGFVIRDDAGHINILCTTSNLTDDNWHFVCGVRNGTQGYIFWSMGNQLRMNGPAALTAGMGSTTASSPLTFVGQDPTGLTPFDGHINDLGCALYAMSPAQVLGLFLESLQGYPNALNWRPLDRIDAILAIPPSVLTTAAPSALLFTAPPPVVSTSATTTPLAAGLLFTAPPPTVTVVNNQTIAAVAPGLLFTAPPATVTLVNPITATPRASGLVFTAPPAQAAILQLIAPAPSELVFTAPPATVQTGVGALPAASGLLFTAPPATVSVIANIMAHLSVANALLLTAPPAQVHAGATATPAVCGLLFTAPPATVYVVQNVNFQATAAALTLTALPAYQAGPLPPLPDIIFSEPPEELTYS